MGSIHGCNRQSVASSLGYGASAGLRSLHLAPHLANHRGPRQGEGSRVVHTWSVSCGCGVSTTISQNPGGGEGGGGWEVSHTRTGPGRPLGGIRAVSCGCGVSGPFHAVVAPAAANSRSTHQMLYEMLCQTLSMPHGFTSSQVHSVAWPITDLKEVQRVSADHGATVHRLCPPIHGHPRASLIASPHHSGRAQPPWARKH